MPAIGNYIGVIKKLGGISWSTYWSQQSEVLFFGLYSEISGGQMPNKVTGATDFLTVAGVAGSETYQAPNTAPYQTADTDYIWFKTDVSQRTTTTAELIGYDFTRTIVKYANTAPYAIEAIMILKSDVDTAKMRNDFDLSIWWDGTLSVYGNLKGNRGAGKSQWYDLEPEMLTYITGLSTELSAAHLTKLNTLVTSLKTGLSISNLSDAFDVMYVLAGETEESSLKNLVKDDHHATNTEATVWTQYEGHKGGAGDYLDTNYNLSTDLDNYSRNNASLGIYKRQGPNNLVEALFGISGVITMYDSGIACRINQSTGGAVTPGLGLNTLIRNALNPAYYQLNKDARQNIAINSTDPTAFNYNIFLLALNGASGDVTNASANIQISFFFIGKYFDTTQTGVIVDAIEAYMDSNSKGVI